jgi:hypothetical protein
MAVPIAADPSGVNGGDHAQLRLPERNRRGRHRVHRGASGRLCEPDARADRTNCDGVGAGDAATVGAAAHTLKGSARAVGADEFAAIALELEQAGKQGNLADAPDTLQRLQTYWQSLEAYLQERLAAA